MKIRFTSIFLGLLLCFSSCVDEPEYDNTPRGNFEALWRIIDEHYCFFDYKRQVYGLDWAEIYSKYAPRFAPGMSDGETFEVLAEMLAELRDGHVNLYSPFDVGRNWSWHEEFPTNFSEDLVNKYLGTNYQIAAGLKYQVFDDNIGYIRCSSFLNNFGEGNLDEIFLRLAPCNGLILDIRNNGGGMITSAEKLAARFTNETLVVGYMQHKTGKGHNDFSGLYPQRLSPTKGIRWQKPVVVLTNRGVYSAANEFVKYIKCFPRVTVVGDQTGGGAGLPFSSELPNGWSVRFSACPIYDRDFHTTEFGIEPHHPVSLLSADLQKDKDTLIEFARHFLAK